MGIHNHFFPDVPEWPSEAPAGPGHNHPPASERIPAEFREALLTERPDFLQLLDNLSGAVERAKCDDEDTLVRCGQLVVTLRKAEQHVAEIHKAQKNPYLEAGRLVDAQKNALVERIAQQRETIEGLQKDYLAFNNVPDTLRGDAVTITKTIEYASHVDDFKKAFTKVQQDPKVQEAISAAVQRIVKATKGAPIPGVSIWTELRVVNR
jgi:hypothetical protein